MREIRLNRMVSKTVIIVNGKGKGKKPLDSKALFIVFLILCMPKIPAYCLRMLLTHPHAF